MIVNVHKRHSRAEYPTDECQTCTQTQAEHDGHEGEYAKPESCPICRGQLDTFLRFGGTLINPQSPDPSWCADAEGYVRAPLVNEGVK